MRTPRAEGIDDAVVTGAEIGTPLIHRLHREVVPAGKVRSPEVRENGGLCIVVQDAGGNREVRRRIRASERNRQLACACIHGRQPMPKLAVMVLGLFVLAESDAVKGSNADVWGVLVFVAVVLLIVWIVRRVRRKA